MNQLHVLMLFGVGSGALLGTGGAIAYILLRGTVRLISKR